MRRQKDICLLCRHVINPSFSRVSNQRYTSSDTSPPPSPPPANFEPFDLPRVVIDLDAADSVFVRKHEDTAAARTSRRPLKLRVPRVQQRETNIQPSTVTNHWMFNTIMPTTPDLLSFALLGLPVASKSPKNDFVRGFLRQQRVLPQDSPEDTIRRLGFQFPTDPSDRLERAGFAKVLDEVRLGKAVYHKVYDFRDFSRLRRILTTISTTAEGCQLLVQTGPGINHAIRKSRASSYETKVNRIPKVTVSMCLTLINNLTQNIIYREFMPDQALCNAGLYYASKAGNLPAVKFYLSKISAKVSHKHEWMFSKALVAMQRIYAKNQAAAKPWIPWKDEKTRKKELLKLITGWHFGDRPEAGKARKLSFALGIRTTLTDPNYFDNYAQYIIGLGEMGLSNALWIEWAALDKVMIPDVYEQRVKVFAIAFILAKDPDRAFTLLDSIPKKSKKEPVTYFDLTRNAIIFHYEFHGLTPSESFEKRLISQSKALEEFIPIAPAESLTLLENLLLIDFPSYVDGSHMDMSVGWREGTDVDGNETGLVVIPKRGQYPVYFKKSGTRVATNRR